MFNGATPALVRSALTCVNSPLIMLSSHHVCPFASVIWCVMGASAANAILDGDGTNANHKQR
jgi:hypothetical protein